VVREHFSTIEQRRHRAKGPFPDGYKLRIDRPYQEVLIMATQVQDIEMEKYTSGLFQPIVDKCLGCERIVEVNDNKYCRTYIYPEAKWRCGICNFATHVKPEIGAVAVKVNPLKASKRAMGKKKK
jgi:hypothetical protein